MLMIRLILMQLIASSAINARSIARRELIFLHSLKNLKTISSHKNEASFRKPLIYFNVKFGHYVAYFQGGFIILKHSLNAFKVGFSSFENCVKQSV